MNSAPPKFFADPHKINPEHNSMFRKMEERTDDIIREEVEEDNQSFTTDSFQVILMSCFRFSTKGVFHFVEPSQNLVDRSQ